MEPDGEFVGIVRGLHFEGHLLMYDPTYNVVEWVPIHGVESDLSPTKDSLACELRNITLLQEMDSTPQMECFGEHWAVHTLATMHDAVIPTPEAKMR